MKTDYNTYTDDELMDALSTINKERYPEQFERLRAEINQRNINNRATPKQGHYHENDTGIDDSLLNDISLEQVKSLHWSQKMTLGIQLALISLMTFLIINIFNWPGLEATSRYKAHVDHAQCEKLSVFDEANKEYITVYDLHLDVLSDTFTALNLPGSTCVSIAKSITELNSISIRHLDGMIYQLDTDDKSLVSFQQLKAGLANYHKRNLSFHIIIVSLLVGMFFRSFYLMCMKPDAVMNDFK